MSAAFWGLAAAMIAATLAVLVVPLLRTRSTAHERKLAALDAALAAGVLDQREHARKREALTRETADAAGSGTPAAPARSLAIALALIVPLAAIVGYRFVGDPRALDPATLAARPAGEAADAPDMEQAVAGLAARLEQNPDDVDGWLLLGRAYKQMQRLEEAKAAFGRVRDRLPDDPDVMVEYAETLALTSPDRAIAGESRTLIEKAAAANPQHQRALWLLGISDAQAGNYVGAIANWERLLPLLPAESDVAKSVGEQIAEARREAGLPASTVMPASAQQGGAASAPAQIALVSPQNAPGDSASPPVERSASASPPGGNVPARDAAPSDGPALTVKVDIAAELKSRVGPGAVLFVFARLPSGPRMPLAIQRLPASSLPLTLTLDDSMGMLPTLKLSTAEQVIVGARISNSGVANAQSGDLEALSAPINVKTQVAPIELTISDVIP